VTYPEPLVDVSSPALSYAEHKERHVVELLTPTDGESEAPMSTVQVHHVDLVLLDLLMGQNEGLVREQDHDGFF